MNVVWVTDEQKTECEMMRRNNVFGTPAGVVDSVAVRRSAEQTCQGHSCDRLMLATVLW